MVNTKLVLGALLSGAHATNNASAVYAPQFTPCPSNVSLTRSPQGLSRQELEWVQGRKKVVTDALTPYLSRLNLTGFDVAAYAAKLKQNQSYVPVLAWANSGGAWRSAFTGMGGLRALDERTPGANEAGSGGLYQCLTYLAGLSGGSWPVASSPFNDYRSIDEQVMNWHPEISRFAADNYSEYAAPLTAYVEQIAVKAQAGFNVSAMDLLGRGFAYQFVPGVNFTWSSIADRPAFQNFSGPFPMLLANSLNATTSPVVEGLYWPSPTAPIYEWTPFEMGSWDIGFTPTKYVGTVPGVDGAPDQCVVNLDQASFVLGSAAAAYNAWWIEAVTNGTAGGFTKRSSIRKRDAPSLPIELLEGLNQVFNETFGLTLPQIANPSVPNAFNPKQNITFTDSSEAYQSMPFWGLIQPARGVDFIMAWDDDGDGEPYSWNNGTNLVGTYNLSQIAGLPFPKIPPVTTILARNYSTKPMLFGCHPNTTTSTNSTSPIVAYFANAPYSYYTNYSGFTTNMSSVEFNGILDNSFNLFTQGNNSLSPGWTQCLGCAAIDRSLARMGMARPSQCEDCFKEYCWDGTTSELPADFVLDPSLALDPGLSFAVWNQTHPFS